MFNVSATQPLSMSEFCDPSLANMTEARFQAEISALKGADCWLPTDCWKMPYFGLRAEGMSSEKIRREVCNSTVMDMNGCGGISGLMDTVRCMFGRVLLHDRHTVDCKEEKSWDCYVEDFDCLAEAESERAREVVRDRAIEMWENGLFANRTTEAVVDYLKENGCRVAHDSYEQALFCPPETQVFFEQIKKNNVCKEDGINEANYLWESGLLANQTTDAVVEHLSQNGCKAAYDELQAMRSCYLPPEVDANEPVTVAEVCTPNQRSDLKERLVRELDGQTDVASLGLASELQKPNFFKDMATKSLGACAALMEGAKCYDISQAIEAWRCAIGRFFIHEIKLDGACPDQLASLERAWDEGTVAKSFEGARSYLLEQGCLEEALKSNLENLNK